jgi:hypothetical protein
MFVHPERTNSGLSRTGGTFPKAFVCQKVLGPCESHGTERDARS